VKFTLFFALTSLEKFLSKVSKKKAAFPELKTENCAVSRICLCGELDIPVKLPKPSVKNYNKLTYSAYITGDVTGQESQEKVSKKMVRKVRKKSGKTLARSVKFSILP